MLLLTATTDKFSVITSSTADVHVHASFVDYNGTVVTPGKQNQAITTATTTDVVASPASSTSRNVKAINIRNKHASASNDVTFQFNANGTLFELHKVTLAAGEALTYTEGVGWTKIPVATVDTLLKVLSADATGADSTTAQAWFPTAGGVTVAADTTYQMQGMLTAIRAAGGTTHTTDVLFAGTATLTGIQYAAHSKTGDVETLAGLSTVVSRVATATNFKATSTSTTEAFLLLIDGFVRINGAGTFIPQFKYQTNAPGGAPTIKSNSYFKLTKLGNGSLATLGTWA